jgi:chemotaxis protein methyltransferase CheR
MGDLAMSSALVSLFGILVEERTGIHAGPLDYSVFGAKVGARAFEAGFESPLDYYYFLRYDDVAGREFDALTESLVVQETYFFRELEPIRVALDEIVLPLVRKGLRPRIWCAASSTGEEPLTIAMLLDERGALGQVDIVASDISERALARARAGVCTRRSLRSTTDAAKARWFTERGDDLVIDPSLPKRVSFERVNLVKPDEVSRLGYFDLILCRNVLIYFSDNVIRRVVGTLAARLREEGRLLVGVSESLLRFGTGLACEELRGSFFYRRPVSRV